MSDAKILELLLALNLGGMLLLYRQIKQKKVSPPPDTLGRFDHDLRSPLTGILGFAELLERQHLSEKQKMYTERIHDCSLEMMSLLRDLAEFSRLQSNKPPPPATHFALHQAVQGAAKEQRGYAKKRVVDLRIEVDSGLLVVADPASLKRCIARIVENAIKVSPMGSEVAITASPSEGGVCLVVSDRGPGISLSEREQVFQMFSPQPRADEMKGRQTQGLSLYLVKRITSLQQARVWVESEGVPGRGSQFHVWIPCS